MAIPMSLRGGLWAVATLDPRTDPAGEGKPDKRPRHPTLKYDGTSYRRLLNIKLPHGGTCKEGKPYPPWARYDECLAAVRPPLGNGPPYGPGAMGRLLQGDFTVLDLDDVTPEAVPWVQQILSGTFIEWSQSGRGLHVWFKGSFPHNIEFDPFPHNVEFVPRRVAEKGGLYGQDHFIVATGNALDASPVKLVSNDWLLNLAERFNPEWEPTGGYVFGSFADAGPPGPATVDDLVEWYHRRPQYTGEFSKGDKTGSGDDWGIAKDLIRGGAPDPHWPSWPVFAEAWAVLKLRDSKGDKYLHRTYCKAWVAIVEELRRRADTLDDPTNPCCDPVEAQRLRHLANEKDPPPKRGA